MDKPGLLAAKIALEAEIVAPLDRVVTQYIGTWSQGSGQISAWDRAGYRDLLVSVLLRHYGRIAYVMTGRKPPRAPRLEEAVHSIRHIESLHSRAADQARLILAGVDRDLAAFMGALGDGFVEDGTKSEAEEIETKNRIRDKLKDITVGYVGRVRAAAYGALNRWRSRAGTVANVNTNAPAEEAALEWAMRVVGNAKLKKRWVSLMDGRERATHHAAHLDYADNAIDVSQPFIVGGAKLMAPGDTSLGAPLSEICNCRCAAVLVKVDEDGKETELDRQTHTPAKTGKRVAKMKIRDGDIVPELSPTSTVTFNGRSRGQIVLGNNQVASFRQEKPNTIIVSIGKRTIARAVVTGGRVSALSIARGYSDRGIGELINRSVSHSIARNPKAFSPN